MSMRHMTIGILGILLAGLYSAQAAPPKSKLKFQGKLSSSSFPVDAACTFRFGIYDAVSGGVPMDTTQVSATVVDGRFNVVLDFTGADPQDLFDAQEARYLETAVCCSGPCTSGGSFTTLTPRQELAAVSNAAMATVGVGPMVVADVDLSDCPSNGPCPDGVKIACSKNDTTCDSIQITARPDVIDLGLAILRSGQVGVNNPNPLTTLHVRGDNLTLTSAALGGEDLALEATDGRVGIYSLNAGSDGSALSLKDVSVAGALNDTWGIARQPSGSGAGLRFTYGASANPFSNSTRVSISPSGTGDNSVSLPTGAIAAAEILDEPGVASNTDGNNVLLLDGSVQTAMSRAITVPTAGYVLAIATCQARLTGGNPEFDDELSAQFGVSTSSSAFPVNQDVLLKQYGRTGTPVEIPVTVQGLFSVSAGTQTLYFLSQKISSLGTVELFDRQLTLVFLPTSYGTVSSTLLGEETMKAGPQHDSEAVQVTRSAPANSKAVDAAPTLTAATCDERMAQLEERLRVLEARLAAGGGQ